MSIMTANGTLSVLKRVTSIEYDDIGGDQTEQTDRYSFIWSYNTCLMQHVGLFDHFSSLPITLGNTDYEASIHGRKEEVESKRSVGSTNYYFNVKVTSLSRSDHKPQATVELQSTGSMDKSCAPLNECPETSYMFQTNEFFKINISLFSNPPSIKCSVSITTHMCPNVTTSRKKNFYNLSCLIENEKFSDITITVGDKKFKAHKAILASRSPVLSTMIDCDMQEKKTGIINITDTDPDIFESFLHFIYTGKVNNLETIGCELLILADKYDVVYLKAKCADFLALNLTVENAAIVLVQSHLMDEDYLKAKTAVFISRNKKDVVASEGWKRMKKTHGLILFEALDDF